MGLAEILRRQGSEGDREGRGRKEGRDWGGKHAVAILRVCTACCVSLLPAVGTAVHHPAVWAICSDCLHDCGGLCPTIAVLSPFVHSFGWVLSSFNLYVLWAELGSP